MAFSFLFGSPCWASSVQFQGSGYSVSLGGQVYTVEHGMVLEVQTNMVFQFGTNTVEVSTNALHASNLATVSTGSSGNVVEIVKVYEWYYSAMAGFVGINCLYFMGWFLAMARRGLRGNVEEL